MKIVTIKLGYVNMYAIVEGEHCVLVDAGLKGKEDKIMSQLHKHGIKKSQIKLIILTHGHMDHFGSLKALVDMTGAKVLVHKLEYNLMRTGREDGIIPLTFMGKIIFATLSKLLKQGSGPREDYHGDILITEPYDLKLHGIDGQVFPTPGHSLGSLSVLLSDGSAIVGDSLMAMMPWQKPGKPMLAYDLQMVKSSMEQLIKIGASRFYLSHGKDYSVQEIEKTLNDLI